MLVAHLPAGYLLGRLLPKKRGVMAACLVGSMFPDFDMIWFHFVDNAQIHHHRYWVHIPLFWMVVTAVTIPALRLFRPGWLPAALGFLAGIALHLVLDTISGGILWGAPVTSHLFVLHEVQPTHDHWVKSFMADWTFGLELLIWGAAILLAIRSRKPS